MTAWVRGAGLQKKITRRDIVFTLSGEGWTEHRLASGASILRRPTNHPSYYRCRSIRFGERGGVEMRSEDGRTTTRVPTAWDNQRALQWIRDELDRVDYEDRP